MHARRGADLQGLQEQRVCGQALDSLEQGGQHSRRDQGHDFQQGLQGVLPSQVRLRCAAAIDQHQQELCCLHTRQGMVSQSSGLVGQGTDVVKRSAGTLGCSSEERIKLGQLGVARGCAIDPPYSAPGMDLELLRGMVGRPVTGALQQGSIS